MMRIVLRRTYHLTGVGRCCLCGEPFDWDDYVAVAVIGNPEQPDAAWKQGRLSVCPTCVAAGPSGIKERALRAAEHQMEWAKQNLEDAQELQSEDIILPSAADITATKREAFHEYFGDEVPYKPEPTTDYFGVCPICHKNDGCLNIGRVHWFVCHEHKVRWCVGSNLFSCWRDQTQANWDANAKRIWDYQEVDPYTDPAWNAPTGAEAVPVGPVEIPF